MKPTKMWIAAISFIALLALLLSCIVVGLPLFIVSLGHVNIFKYVDFFVQRWGALARWV